MFANSLEPLANTKPSDATFCQIKEWMLNHMPAFDLHFLPPSVSVRGTSMLDDTIFFGIMALRQVTSTSYHPSNTNRCLGPIHYLSISFYPTCFHTLRSTSHASTGALCFLQSSLTWSALQIQRRMQCQCL